MTPSFIHDDRAALEIPLRLVVYVILTGAIIAIAAIGISHLGPGNSMEKQLGTISVSLNTMQYGAARNLLDPVSPAGNIRTFKIVIPEDVIYLAFGADPDPDNDNNLTNTREGLVTERGNVIFYMSGAGKKRMPLEDEIELREGLLENGKWILNTEAGREYGVVIRGKGTYELTFEQVYDPISKRKFILIHHTDDLKAIINPYDPKILPNRVWVSVFPASIPADGAIGADVTVQLKDKQGRDAVKPGVEIHLGTTLGNLSAENLSTDSRGRAATSIISDLIGTALITASSAGLNSGSTIVTITQKPVILDFERWITAGCWSAGLWCETQSEQFTSMETLNYSVALTANARAEWWQLWPLAIIEIDGMKLGEASIYSTDLVIKNYPRVLLPAGAHTLNITMTNDRGIPGLGGDLYIERVVLSE